MILFYVIIAELSFRFLAVPSYFLRFCNMHPPGVVSATLAPLVWDLLNLAILGLACLGCSVSASVLSYIWWHIASTDSYGYENTGGTQHKDKTDMSR